MDFSQAIEYLAAIIVIVAAGVLLGMALRRPRPSNPRLRLERVRSYSELVSLMDGLRQATGAHKRHFVDAYYQALLYAPDEVVRALNRFVQVMTLPDSEYDASKVMEVRDAAVRTMREDAQAQFQARSQLGAAELFSIEVSDDTHWRTEPTAEPQSDETGPDPETESYLPKPSGE